MTRVFDVPARLWIDNKFETRIVRLEIDLADMAVALGSKAARNKSGRSKLAVGVKAQLIGKEA